MTNRVRYFSHQKVEAEMRKSSYHDLLTTQLWYHTFQSDTKMCCFDHSKVHQSCFRSTDDKTTTLLFVEYCRLKRGLDSMDQMQRHYTTKVASLKFRCVLQRVLRCSCLCFVETFLEFSKIALIRVSLRFSLKSQ